MPKLRNDAVDWERECEYMYRSNERPSESAERLGVPYMVVLRRMQEHGYVRRPVRVQILVRRGFRWEKR